jgi:hypothetical protein
VDACLGICHSLDAVVESNIIDRQNAQDKFGSRGRAMQPFEYIIDQAVVFRLLTIGHMIVQGDNSPWGCLNEATRIDSRVG